MEEDLSDDELLYIRSRRKKYLLLQKQATETSNSRNILKSQGILISALYLRNTNDRLTGFADVLEKKSDLEFFKLLRVTKVTFHQLVQNLENYERDNKVFKGYGGYAPISAKLGVMATLWYLGKPSNYHEIADKFGICTSSAYRLVERTIYAINEIYKTSIKWPSEESAIKIEKEFKVIADFPGVIGAAGGCHIKIKPPEEYKREYLNKASKHSIILFAVCDAQKRFTFINVGFPGSADDQFVFLKSPLGVALTNDYKSMCYSDNYHIIGDNAFALKNYMMVPFKKMGNLSVEEIQFNSKLLKTRGVIEDAFEMLKGRFRKLQYIIESEPGKITSFIIASCILHNLTLDSEDEHFLLEDEIDNFGVDNGDFVPQDCLENDPKSGIEKRRDMLQKLKNE